MCIRDRIQHDGFTATKQLNVATLERAILDATGYALTLEEELIQPDIQAQFDKSIQNELEKERKKAAKEKRQLLKVWLASKANAGEGFRYFGHHQNTVNSDRSPHAR